LKTGLNTFPVLETKRLFPKQALSLPHTLPRETEAITTTQDIVKRFNIKQPSFEGDPPQLVFTFPTHSYLIQHSKERDKEINLPIMSRFGKAYVPLDRTTRKFHVSRKYPLRK
jgi:hypothetical protein